MQVQYRRCSFKDLTTFLFFLSLSLSASSHAGVQLQQPGIQPEEMDGVGNDAVASDS